jgi:hypothetical protein
MVAFSARPTSTNELTQLVNLTAHGFHVGQVLIYNGAWVLANASSASTSAGAWIVSIVPSVDTFYLTQTGWVNNLNSAYFDGAVITPGIQYYLSAVNSGNFSSTKPVGGSDAILPCLVCDTTTTGYFYGGSGYTVTAPSSIAWNPVATNTTMTSNNGYYVTTNSTLTLPATSAIGDIIRIANFGATGFTVAQHAGQQITGLGVSTTSGVGGSLVATNAGCSVEMVCLVASSAWQIISSTAGLAFN